jgi:hypothetical protein
MDLVPTTHHLRHVKLTMAYCELPEDGVQPISWTPHQKWKSDPEVNDLHGFAPSNKHFINGELVSEDKPSLRQASSLPFRRQRVPRRGFVAIPRDDPAYGRLCKEQGLNGRVTDAESQVVPNGVRSSPTSVSSHMAVAAADGPDSPRLNTTAMTNGTSNQPISPSSESGPAQARPLVNGIHGTLNSSSD